MFRGVAQQFDVFCPKCGGPSDISKRYRAWKRLLRYLRVYTFRCRRCNYRFFRFRPKFKGRP